MTMDGLTKYKSAEEEAADLKADKEEREKLIEKHIEEMSAQWFKAEYLAESGSKTVTVNLLSRQLAKLRKSMTRRILNEVCALQDGLVEHCLIVHRDRIRALKAEVAELKAGGPNLADCYRGSWMVGAYRRGSVVSASGSLWLALKDTEEKPGSGDAWKLVCKRGADGKDLR